MSKRFIEIQKNFPPVPLTPSESRILQQYEQYVEESIKQKDLKGILRDPPYPYYKKQCWKKIQWMQVDIETKIQSLEKHTEFFLQRYTANENKKDFHRYTELSIIIHSYKEYGLSKEMLITLFCTQNPIPSKIFPYELGKICLLDAVKYGFIEDFLQVEQNLTTFQLQAHNIMIQQNFNDYNEE